MTFGREGCPRGSLSYDSRLSLFDGQEMLYIMLFSAMMVALVSGSTNGEQKSDESAVLVKINPFISKSRRIIQFGGDGRYKRNSPEKSALYLEFPESFFEDPKLERLYKALIGGGSSGNSKKSIPEKTDIVFQIDPSAFVEGTVKGKHKKRDVRGDELAAFNLKIAPAAPHVKQMKPGLQGFVPRHETTKAWCMETMLEWKPKPVTEAAEPSTADVVAETMCYPSKPSTPRLRICGGTTTEDFTSARPNDPCQCNQVVSDSEQQVETTPYDLYTQCKSEEPVVTHHVETLCFTTERCSPKTTDMSCSIDVTYNTTTKPSCLPSSTGMLAFQRFFKRRKKENQLGNFFKLSNSPQSCPPFCPPQCTSSTPNDCKEHTATATKQCLTSSSCPDTSPTCASPGSTTTSCIPTTSNNQKDQTTFQCTPTSNDHICPKVKRLDDPLRNVLQLFRRRNLKRIRRNPPPFRRRRRLLVYKPKHGLRKVNFRTNEYAPSLK